VELKEGSFEYFKRQEFLEGLLKISKTTEYIDPLFFELMNDKILTNSYYNIKKEMIKRKLQKL
jgi:hypothetical protein